MYIYTHGGAKKNSLLSFLVSCLFIYKAHIRKVLSICCSYLLSSIRFSRIFFQKKLFFAFLKSNILKTINFRKKSLKKKKQMIVQLLTRKFKNC
jgi:hypothetical protein